MIRSSCSSMRRLAMPATAALSCPALPSGRRCRHSSCLNRAPVGGRPARCGLAAGGRRSGPRAAIVTGNQAASADLYTFRKSPLLPKPRNVTYRQCKSLCILKDCIPIREDEMAVEKIQYQAGKVTGHGALVWNEKVSGKRPLLLVMTNWLGVTDIAVKRAAKMAGDKYVAFVADMYGDGKT